MKRKTNGRPAKEYNGLTISEISEISGKPKRSLRDMIKNNSFTFEAILEKCVKIKKEKENE